MIKNIRNILVLIMIFFMSCEKQGQIVSCGECTEEEPKGTVLQIKYESFESFDGPTRVNVYFGNIEDSLLLRSYSSVTDPILVYVQVNTRYTVTATYNDNGVVYTAIDSATPRVRYEKDFCENPCYFVYDKKLDLRIKYMKKN